MPDAGPTVRSGAWPGPKPVIVGGDAVAATAPLTRSWSPLPTPVVSSPSWTHWLSGVTAVAVNAVPFSWTVSVTWRPAIASEKALLVASVDSSVPNALPPGRIHSDTV